MKWVFYIFLNWSLTTGCSLMSYPGHPIFGRKVGLTPLQGIQSTDTKLTCFLSWWLLKENLNYVIKFCKNLENWDSEFSKNFNFWNEVVFCCFFLNSFTTDVCYSVQRSSGYWIMRLNLQASHGAAEVSMSKPHSIHSGKTIFPRLKHDYMMNSTLIFVFYSKLFYNYLIDKEVMDLWINITVVMKSFALNCPVYDTKPSDDEATVLELWGMLSIPSSPLLRGPLWPSVVVLVRVPSMGQIYYLIILLYLKPFNSVQTNEF